MDPRTNRTFICSVLFLDIVEYSKKPVMEQIQIKDRFNHLLSEAIKDIAVNDRIILDTGDGAAIGFLGDPEDALFVAMGIRDSVTSEEPENPALLSIRMGINLGPVRMIKDLNKQINLIGDGINVAQRIMSFAQPGQLLVSRSYFDVISCLSQEYASLFDYKGTQSDKHIREHEIYAVGHYVQKHPDAKVVEVEKQHIVETAIDASFSDRLQRKEEHGIVPPQQTIKDFGKIPPSSIETKTSSPRKKWMFAAIPLAVIALLIAFFASQSAKGPSKAPPATTAPVVAPQPQSADSQPSPSNINKTAVAPPAAVPMDSGDAATPAADSGSKAAQAEAPVKLSSIRFRVLPWGEIYVNGEKKGVSPPITTIKLKPGQYHIQIKNTTFSPYTHMVKLKSNETIQIKHKFR